MEKEKVLEHIRDAIVQGKYSSEHRLIERELCNEFNAKRSCVRQALQQLSVEGFVSIEHFKGAWVAKLEQRDIAQIYDILGALEGLSIRIAIATINDIKIRKIESLIIKIEKNCKNATKLYKANMELHKYITSLSNNPRLISFCKNLRLQAYRMSLENFYISEQVQASLIEHRTILDCIKRHDALTAENLIREHYQKSQNRLIKAINNSL